jgi:hypothetical protein
MAAWSSSRPVIRPAGRALTCPTAVTCYITGLNPGLSAGRILASGTGGAPGAPGRSQCR